MSTRRYRRILALGLVTSVGLTLAACTSEGTNSSGKVTITVDCPPLKTDNGGKSLAQWNKDVAAFEAANPTVDIITISVGAQCNNPPDFTARLQGGTQADVFYGYMTDLQQVLDADAAEDVTQYVNSDTIPNWNDVLDSVKAPFIDNGKIYGIGYSAYTMGLVYNKKLFSQAGLDPNKPPSTWQDVATAAKTISAKVPGVAGYSEYSAGNTGGWHFTASLYSRGSSPVSADGKKANVQTPQAKAVLQNLKNMLADNSVGTTQLQTWPDLLTNAAAGKVGMYLGAPDSVTAIVNTFKGNFADWAIAPMPGDGGAAKGALGGGNGYFFKKGLSADQIRAGLKWLAYEEFTPGQGQFNYAVQKEIGLPVGLPQPLIWKPGSAQQKKDDELKKSNSNLNLADYALYTGSPVNPVAEPANAQAIYAILDGPMGAVLTNPAADIDALLADAQAKIQKVLDDANK
jgi:multiple sugar transport system substrate-binding protein